MQRRCHVIRFSRTPGNLGQTKVQQLRLPIRSDEQVSRLDVAMDNSLAMRGRQPIRNPYRQFQQRLGLDELLPDPVLQRHTLKKLHRNEAEVIVGIDLINRADIRMVQRRSRPSLPPEPLQRQLILGHIRRQELQRHKPPQVDVLSLIDDAHPAAAQILDNAVVRDRRSNHDMGPFRRCLIVRAQYHRVKGHVG